jgi:Tol biopolymer transport system component
VREPKRKEGNSDIYTMKANGGGGKRLTRTKEEYEYKPNWSPNGRKIAFDSRADTGEVLGISMMKANGGGRRQLTELYGEEPAWSPSGNQIVFAWGNIYRAPVPSRTEGPIAPGVPFQVTDEPGQYSDYGPDWQPR